MAKTIPFNIKLSVDGRQVMVSCKRDVENLGKALGTLPTGVRRFQSSLVAFSAFQSSLSNLSGAIGNISGLMQGYIDKANNASVVQTKLTTIMRQRMGASEADVASMNKMVAVQTHLGIIGGTVQRSGLQQLATFASHKATLETLLPAMNNLLAQQKGVNATSEDAVGVANLMGKALMGNVGALTRVGITLTDHQKELIKTGDEYTRATTLAQAITDNVGNMNAELAKTESGKVKQAANNFAALQARVGKALQPFQESIVMFSQVGMAVTGVVQMGTAIGGVTRALFGMTGITAISNMNNLAATGIVRGLTSAFGMASVSITGATLSVKALTWAIRGLEVATVVGAVIAGVSMLFDTFAPKLDQATESSNKLGSSLSGLGDTFEQQRKQALAPTLTKYQELQTKWKQLKSAHEKNQFLKANKDGFQQLGVSINSVGQAESCFDTLGGYAAAGAAGLASIGGALEQIGGQGEAAKAGAVMAAIGQIVLGFATYTAKSAGLGPWGWVAAVASGLGIVASTVAALKGYATGGVLTGPTSSGDKLLFRGNAGEMIFNSAQQRRLYALANGSYLPRLPLMQPVRPQIGSLGNMAQVVTVNVRGRLNGNSMELMGSNTRSLGAKIGKRW